MCFLSESTPFHFTIIYWKTRLYLGSPDPKKMTLYKLWLLALWIAHHNIFFKWNLILSRQVPQDPIRFASEARVRGRRQRERSLLCCFLMKHMWNRSQLPVLSGSPEINSLYLFQWFSSKAFIQRTFHKRWTVTLMFKIEGIGIVCKNKAAIFVVRLCLMFKRKSLIKKWKRTALWHQQKHRITETSRGKKIKKEELWKISTIQLYLQTQ